MNELTSSLEEEEKLQDFTIQVQAKRIYDHSLLQNSLCVNKICSAAMSILISF